MRLSSTGCGACVDEDRSGLAREETVLSWSRKIACDVVVEAWSLWVSAAVSERWSATLQTGYKEGTDRMSSTSVMAEAKNRVGAELVSWCREKKTLRIGLKIKNVIFRSLPSCASLTIWFQRAQKSCSNSGDVSFTLNFEAVFRRKKKSYRCSQDDCLI